MIIVRDVFQLQFGKAKDAVTVCKAGLENAKDMGNPIPMRIMTDLVGKYYTLVMESTFDSLSHYEQSMREMFDNEQWRDWYQKLLPFLESGHREIFTLV